MRCNVVLPDIVLYWLCVATCCAALHRIARHCTGWHYPSSWRMHVKPAAAVAFTEQHRVPNRITRKPSGTWLRATASRAATSAKRLEARGMLSESGGHIVFVSRQPRPRFKRALKLSPADPPRYAARRGRGGVAWRLPSGPGREGTHRAPCLAAECSRPRGCTTCIALALRRAAAHLVRNRAPPFYEHGRCKGYAAEGCERSIERRFSTSRVRGNPHDVYRAWKELVCRPV